MVKKSVREWPLLLKMSVLANLFYYGFFISSGILFPGYDLFKHSVSSLGASSLNPEGWYLFSIALILIGITFIPFYLEMDIWLKETPNKKKGIRIAQFFGFLDAISMWFIAFYPTDSKHEVHFIFSMVNFFLIILTTFTLVVTLCNHPSFDKRIGYYGIFVCILCSVYGILSATVVDLFFLEHLTFPNGLLFSLLIGLNSRKLVDK